MLRLYDRNLIYQQSEVMTGVTWETRVPITFGSMSARSLAMTELRNAVNTSPVLFSVAFESKIILNLQSPFD